MRDRSVSAEANTVDRAQENATLWRRDIRPVPGRKDNPIAFWRIYPQYLRDLFTRETFSWIVDRCSLSKSTPAGSSSRGRLSS
jgi:hypothetical protein